VIRGDGEPVLPGRGAGLTLGVRPEHIRLVAEGGVPGTVTSAEYHGADTVLTARVGEESLLVRAPGQAALGAGARVRLGWEKESVHLFDSANGRRAGLA
jgi:sn-glycerol 3-phosphate transport system ATP-binding protein